MKQNDFDYMQMLKGELYYAPTILPENKSTKGKVLAQKINQLPIDNVKEIVALEKELLGKTGNELYITPPLHVDYGRHIEVGENFYANMDCIFLDVNKIIFGDNVMVGPRASFYTAGHPIDPTIRTAELEFGTPIIVEDNVWIGGSATILPALQLEKMLLSLLVLWLQKTFLPTRLLEVIQQKSFAKLMKTISNFGQKSNGSIKSLRSNSFMNKKSPIQ